MPCFFPGYVCGLKLLGTLNSIIYLPSSFIRAWDWQLKICKKKKKKIKKNVIEKISNLIFFSLQNPAKSGRRIRKPSNQKKRPYKAITLPDSHATSYRDHKATYW